MTDTVTDDEKPGFWSRSPIGTTIMLTSAVLPFGWLLLDTRGFGLNLAAAAERESTTPETLATALADRVGQALLTLL